MIRWFGIFMMCFLIHFSSITLDASPPNIIMVITDDQGYGDLGCHGNPLIKTPNIDSFSKQAINLTDYHVSPTCSPTRGALMCGQYTNKAGSWHTINGRSYLRAEKLTIPQLLRDKGYYQTAMFGKWHLGDNYPYRPQDRGFQYALYHGGGGVNQAPDYFGNDYFDDTYFVNGKPKKFKGYCTDVFFEEGMKWMENASKKGKPFFMYISTNAPHSPYIVDKKYRDLYPETYEGKTVPREFFGMITNIDENFKKLDDKLFELGLTENTLLIFTTDNGSSAGSNFYNSGMKGKKGSCYDGGHRVPFIARWPAGNWKGGIQIDRLTAHIDILPTFMNIAGVKLDATHDLDGRSLLPLINGEKWEDRILMTDSQRIYTPLKWRNTSVMNETWRLLNNKLLFNIEKDPGQKVNVASQFPEVVEKLSKAYDEIWSKMEPGLAKPTYVTVGTEFENPAILTSHDWRGDIDIKNLPWSQSHIVEGIDSNGYWTANFNQSGKYRFLLRRWPPEIDWTIHFLEKDRKLNLAKLRIGEKFLEKAILLEDEGVEFILDISAGVHDIQSYFCADKKEIRGAYYLIVEHLGN